MWPMLHGMACPLRLKALCLYAVVLVVAFDYDSHDAVGQTAASGMEELAIKHAKRILGGKDVTDIAGWGHQVDDTFPGMSRLHFQVHDDKVQPFCGPAKERVAKCPDNVCLLEAIKHFYGKTLSREGRPMDYPEINFGKVSSGLKFSDADSVKMFVNLIGDLHQPLHVGYASGDMGRDVKVKLGDKDMSLYDLWDKGIATMIKKEEPSFWLGSWTHITRIRDKWEEDKKLYQSEGAFKSFERWMEESVTYACENVYVVGDRWLAGPSAINEIIDFKEDGRYEKLKAGFLDRVLVAGGRLALVLNDLLDPKKGANKLDEGSTVTTKADEEETREFERLAKERRERSTALAPARWNTSNFLTNLFIAALVVPAFFIVANWGTNPSTYANLVKSAAASPGTQPHSGRSRFD
eukprot:NODE_7001_length_1618_cov_4.388330.p1 GENE.NODE_7001_length_1618_cov_4.388330~~NODE_7001_length_1618_cov_4.388330.p1  ORF type:complete len:450 (+),score=113.26 NODE_7001_length_1618_cov_4.388330:129-1352(+)